MQLLEKILAPVDFSAGTDDLLRLTADLARRFRSEVILQFVLPHSDESLLTDAAGLLDAALASAQARLDACRQTLVTAGARVHSVLLDRGVPAECIITRAGEHDVNLILLNASSNQASTDASLGMTAAGVRRGAAQPVWLVKPNAGLVPRVILCPVDLSAASERALENAIHLARQLEARLHVLTVVPLLSGWTSLRLSVDEAAEAEYVRAESSRFTEFLRGFDFRDVTWEQSVRRGDPVEQIQTAVRELQTELLVMGSTVRTGLRRMFAGNVTEKIATRLPCSLLTMTNQDAIRLKIDSELSDLETHYARGRDLLKNGFPHEAAHQFEHCVHINDMFAPGWAALAEAHERCGDARRAEHCRETATRIREALSWRMVEADVRARHPLWKRLTRRK